MKTILFFFVSVLTAFSLAGCGGGIQTVRVIEQQNYVLVEPDAVYLTDCGMASPPPKPNYALMSMDEREDSLTTALLANIKYQQECTLDKRFIRSVVEKNRILIQEQNEKEAKRVSELKKE